MKRSGVGFDAVGSRGFLQGLSPAITESIKLRDCHDGIAPAGAGRRACARQKTRSRNLSIPAALEELSTISQHHGRGGGVGRGLGVGGVRGVGEGLAVAVGVAEAVAVGVAVAVAVAVGVALTVGVAVAVGVGDGEAHGGIS